MLKSKDKKIYDKNTVLFENKKSGEEEGKSEDKSSSKEKPFYLKDLEREMILKK